MEELYSQIVQKDTLNFVQMVNFKKLSQKVFTFETKYDIMIM